MADDALSPPPKLDFTARDWPTNVAALKDMVRVREVENWNSFFAGDLGTVLLEAIAYDSSMLSYVIDAQTQEGFIDTLRLRESVLHFSRLTAYPIRRGTTASVEVYALTNQPPSAGNRFRINAGMTVRDKGGLVWEVDRDYEVVAGRQTPVAVVVQYGDVRGKFITPEGATTEVDALVKLTVGSSVAELVNRAGDRLGSEVNFGPGAGPGHVLRLLNGYEDGAFTVAPPTERDEFAVVEPGKYSYDIYPNSVLYLDRPWDGPSNWVGKWRVENRSILLRQGQSKEESFTAPSDLADRRSFKVRGTFGPMAMGGLEASVPSGFSGNRILGGTNSGLVLTVDGVTWRETSSLLFEPPDSTAYEVDFDEDDKFIITFGDGVFGAVVPQDAVVRVSYRIGGGAAGNIPQNSIDTAVPVDSGTPGTPAQLYLANPYTVGRGGQDRESVTSAKRNIPQHVRTNDRAVSVEDYGYLASNFVDPVAGRIKLAKGVLHKNAVPREQNVVWVYAWAEGVGGQLAPPTLALKGRLLSYLDERKMITDEVVVIDGNVSPVAVELRYCFSTGSDRATARQRVQSALNGVFSALLPGDTLRLSGIYEAVESVPDVKFCRVINPKSDVVASNEFELFTNPLQIPASTRLVTPLYKGDRTIVVSDPSPFYEKGLVGIYESLRTPTVGVVESVASNVITLRQDTPVADNYSTDATVADGPYHPLDWQFERPTDVVVNYDTGNGTQAVVTGAIRRSVRRYFEEVLKPEEPLTRTRLQLLALAVTNVTSAEAYLRAFGNEEEQIVPSSAEKVTLGTLTINGTVV